MSIFRRTSALLFAGAASLSFSPALHAEDAAPTTAADASANGKRQFRADFFVAYAPVTALDMVRRIPGFSIAGDEGRRGFGENAGNVLIDGDRPSSKSDDIFTILSRIPASEVEGLCAGHRSGGGPAGVVAGLRRPLCGAMRSLSRGAGHQHPGADAAPGRAAVVLCHHAAVPVP